MVNSVKALDICTCVSLHYLRDKKRFGSPLSVDSDHVLEEILDWSKQKQ